MISVGPYEFPMTDWYNPHPIDSPLRYPRRSLINCSMVLEYLATKVPETKSPSFVCQYTIHRAYGESDFSYDIP